MAVLILILIFFLILLLCWNLYENRSFENTYYNVFSDEIEEPVRAVFLADLHQASYGEDNQDLIDAIQKLQPDLILTGGDMVNENEPDVASIVKLCSRLVSVAPVYCGMGKHESVYCRQNLPDIPFLLRGGVRLSCNERGNTDMHYKVTPAEAANMIRKVMEEKSDEIEKERQSSVFNAAVGENPESVRPEYSYNQTQKFIQECDRKIRIIKHAINCFNTTQKIGYGDMTIDEALVRVSQLTEAKKRLHDLQIRIPKERVSALGSENSSFIDYRYTNYSITEARSYYQKISYTLRNLQAALEVINVTAKVEFDLPD